MVFTQKSNGYGTAGAGTLFQIFRDGQARTKSELVELTGLARSTVSARVDQLLQLGILAPAGEAASSGGRPPAKIAFNPKARLILAIDLGATHGIVALADLNGEILHSTRTELKIADGPETILSWVIETTKQLLSAHGYSVSDLAGAGIGVPGPVEFSTGQPTKPPIMPGWDRFKIPSYIQAHFNIPVLVDNDVNILAIGEQATTWPNVSDLLFVKVSTGIGSGIISGGVLQRGAQGTAGDLGHVQVPYNKDSARNPEDERDLEAIASGPAIAQLLQAEGLTEVSSSQDVVELLNEGNQLAINATREAGRYIGEVLATCVNMLNPSVIVIGGSIARASEQLIAGIREVVYKRSIPLATQHLGIVQARGGELAGVRGAAIMVTQSFLSEPSVDRMVAISLES